MSMEDDFTCAVIYSVEKSYHEQTSFYHQDDFDVWCGGKKVAVEISELGLLLVLPAFTL